MRTRRRTTTAAAIGLMLALAACSDGSTDSAAPAPADEPAPSATTAALTETRGPNGEEATPVAELTLTPEEINRVQAGDYSAALLWHTSSDFVSAVASGAKDEFDRLDIEVVATTDAQFDAAKQASDVETVMAKDPDIIVSLPVDPTSAAEAFQPAVDAGVELVFLSNVPAGYTHGEDYVSIVTDDLFQMGKQAADALAESIGGEGEVGWIYHDAEYYVTNQRDNAFKTTIEQDYPEIEIVAEAGIADPARAEETATAMLTKNPDLDGIYVTWAEPAEGVLAALRNAGNTDTKVVTLDLSEPVAVDMVSGGNTVALVADKAYDLGVGLARAAAYGLLDKEAPPFVVAPALTVTAENVAEGWQESLHRDPPAAVLEAAEQ
jgi:ribose transport system substrate-binding protein